MLYYVILCIVVNLNELNKLQDEVNKKMDFLIK